MNKKTITQAIKKNKKTIMVILTILLIKIILHANWNYYYNYDHNRNLIVTRELRTYGALTYFGRAYVVNPPLYYMINSLIGDTHAVLKYSELIIYFLASITEYLIAKRLLNEKAGLIAYALMMLTPLALQIEELDFIAISLLMTGLLILAYDDFIKKQDAKNTLKLGITISACMLTKDTLAIMIILVTLHYIIFERKKPFKAISAVIISLIIYTPWILYLNFNQLPLPWQSHMSEITGNIEWANNQSLQEPIYRGYELAIKAMPVMAITTIIASLILKKKNTLIKLTLLISIAGPLIQRIILNYFSLDHMVSILLTYPIITGVIIESTKKYKNITYLLTGLIITEFTMGNINIITNEGSFDIYECEIFDYVSNLKTSDTVLLFQEPGSQYTLFKTLSKASIERASAENLKARALLLSSNKVITDQDLGIPSEKIITCNNLFKTKVTYYIYPINIELDNLTSKSTIKVIDEQGNPLGDAIINVTIKDAVMHLITSNAGESIIQADSDLIKATVTRNGYEIKEITELKNQTITLKKTPFIINYKITRY